MKHLQGKIVYLRPTGNNASKYKSKIINAKIVHVAKVFITFTTDTECYQVAKKYRYEGNELTKDNSGFIVYETKKEIEDHYKAENLAFKIYGATRYPFDLKRLGLDKLLKIAEIIGV